MPRVVPAVLALTVALVAAVAGMAPPRAESLIERAFAEYEAGDPRAISRIIPRAYFAGSGKRTLQREVDAALSRWTRDRRRVQVVFLLELVRFGLIDLGEPVALDVFTKARLFVTGRPESPGRNAQEDAFEIAWHKTAIALLGGIGQPGQVENVGLAPLRRRMAASPAASGPPRLIDPWVELAGAFLQDQRTIVDPMMLASAGPGAIRRYDEAARYGENRPEALVRKSWLLVRLRRYTEAIAALDALGASSDLTDASVRYWNRLFRGRALAGLGRDGEASRSYEEALAIIPGAQTPLAALTAIEARRGNLDAAFRWAARGPFHSPDRVDPWLQYGDGDYRHFETRLEHLREASR